MKKIKKIYEINGGNLDIIFDDNKSVLLNGIDAGLLIPKWIKRYGDELMDIKKSDIKFERDYKRDGSEDEISEIEKVDSNYYLLILGKVNNYPVQISPQELKFLLFIDRK